MKLIDKDALVAEIKRRITQFRSEKSKEDASVSDKLSLGGRIAALEEFKVFINTFEVKEVDLEKEIEEYVLGMPMSEFTHESEVEDSWDWARKSFRHFFELGLKAQQNISINVTDIDKVFEENGVDPNSKEAKMFKESYYMALEKLKARKGMI